VKMTVRHQHLLRLVHSWCPCSHLYIGPTRRPATAKMPS
jgi:hypothetical protein